MPVYRPESTEGVSLRRVTIGRPCQNQQVTAVYRPRALRIARSMRLVAG
jgi:hypothetical protein